MIEQGPTPDVVDSIVSILYSDVEKEFAKSILQRTTRKSESISWSNLIGMENAKSAILNSVVGPILNPKVFQFPMRGMLLYGPPGTGKTFISKATATESKATFFYVDEAAIKSEKHSETERMISALFRLARFLQPSVVFIDEAESLLRSPIQSDHPDIRTIFEKEMDGFNSFSGDRVFVMAATNSPWSLEKPVIDRLAILIYVPLPSEQQRMTVLTAILSKMNNNLNDEDIARLASQTTYFSHRNLINLCRVAQSKATLNLIDPNKLDSVLQISEPEMVPIEYSHFEYALQLVRPNVSAEEVRKYEEWQPNVAGQPQKRRSVPLTD